MTSTDRASARRPRNRSTPPSPRRQFGFYEYFHGDNGAGIGASHQTGWTALVANLLDEIALERSTAAAGTAADLVAD